MTVLPFLVGIVTALVELVKATLKAFNLLQDDAQREAVVRYAALVIGIGVALAAGYNPFAGNPDVNISPYVASVFAGIALGLMSDLLHVATDIGKALPTRLNAAQASTTATVTTTGGGEASASVSSPEMGGKPDGVPDWMNTPPPEQRRDTW